jgi:hypothetical protein
MRKQRQSFSREFKRPIYFAYAKSPHVPINKDDEIIGRCP